MSNLDIEQYIANRPNIYIDRHVRRVIESSFSIFESVILLGPRQIGKSTLATTYFAKELGAVYRDLEDRSSKNEIGDGKQFFRRHKDKIIILDEVQESPDLFKSIKVHIDYQRRTEGNQSTKFLLLGSANLDLQTKSAKSLTGRSSEVQMTGILLNELLDSLPDSFSSPSDNTQPHSEKPESLPSPLSQILNLLLIRGGMPNSLFAKDSSESRQMLTKTLKSYVQNDLRSFGFNVDATKLFDCLTLIAKTNGTQYELGRFARNLELDRTEVNATISALEQLLLIRKLAPLNGFGEYKVKLARQPKIYIRDSGLLSSRLNISTAEDLRDSRYLGEIWEGFVIETIIGAAINAGIYEDCRYFRTHKGDLELDMVLNLSQGGTWGIEIKFSDASQPSPGNIDAAQMIEVDRRIIVHAGMDAVQLNGGFTGLPLIEVLKELQRLGES